MLISDIARILNDIRVRKTDVAHNMNETKGLFEKNKHFG
jgi:hypothetical protein